MRVAQPNNINHAARVPPPKPRSGTSMTSEICRAAMALPCKDTRAKGRLGRWSGTNVQHARTQRAAFNEHM
eukprot:15475312-Alexandrium_andersonii.AAC.1